MGGQRAGGALLIALTLLTQGTRPTVDFVTHALPEISSGAAFPHTEWPRTRAVNWTIYGMTVRLRSLGLPGLDQPIGLRVVSIYGVLVIALAAVAGWMSRRRFNGAGHDAGQRLALLQVALALLGLASFRSPFAGAPYGSMSTLWLMAFLAAGASSGGRALVWLAAMFGLGMGIAILPSPSTVPGRFTIAVSGVLFLGSLGLNVWAIWRAAPASSRRSPANPGQHHPRSGFG